MRALCLENLGLTRNGRRVLDAIGFSLETGECVGLIGPNGAGKTSLLRAALGLLPSDGRSSLAALSLADRAHAAAFLPQSRDIAWPISVRELVSLGRIAQKGEGEAAVDAALHALQLDDFADRPATALSGGEQARALIARALAQETPLIIADEPIAGLDPAAQLQVMALFAKLAVMGRGILVSIHDLGLAARYCTRLIVLDQGRIIADGAPRAVLTPDLLKAVFGIRAYMNETADGFVLQPLEVVK